jgi:hypothetical protein
MLRSKFNFDVWFVIYRFFKFNQCCMWPMSSILIFLLYECTPLKPSATCYYFVAEATCYVKDDTWLGFGWPVLILFRRRRPWISTRYIHAHMHAPPLLTNAPSSSLHWQKGQILCCNSEYTGLYWIRFPENKGDGHVGTTKGIRVGGTRREWLGWIRTMDVNLAPNSNQINALFVSLISHQPTILLSQRL